MKIIQAKLITKKSKIAIITTRFNEFINNRLLKSCVQTLKRIGNLKSNDITIIKVPGAYEIPITAEIIAHKKEYNAIITLGTIIKGKTRHNKFIENSLTYGLSKISITNRIPIITSILMTNNINETLERCGIKLNNKGSEAALSALEIINVIKKINQK
ncbi:6,7-dimethyl-8-ribityllumazine synthase [Buchnera aphidicola]|uniref:6,7-dimethyl-8-ribityllumazine synthase n=1 Tax=Buchnera aphidicola TaxID=9 RepID=UPI00223809AB|nr:6,7-dimethyl-8-ribityllumazine synthase [Buchnera aphidicola]MCW5197534.1 6,7-dimethyl-8-ribityllumazine synthase [Buchnera aphidicola (Chaitophorus viminalis)]